MNRSIFIRRREERWRELEALVLRAEGRGGSTLSAGDILELGRLYRSAASDLAVALKYFPQDRTTIYLNGLVRRAHPLVYQPPPSSRSGILDAVRFSFPSCYRQLGQYTATAFGLCAGSALVAAAAVVYHPANADLLLGHPQAQSLRQVMSLHHLWMGQNTANHSVAANFIMLNNIQVAFLAFAGGILLGLGTVVVLVQNGVMIVAIAAMVSQYGLSRQFWSFVVPHGVIELSVIFMAGGAGLAMGDAILRPGLSTRGQALVQAARKAAVIVLGAIPLLMIAGTIEGFYTASNSPAYMKVAVGAVSGFLLYAYLLGSRRRAGSARQVKLPAQLSPTGMARSEGSPATRPV